MNDRFQMKLFRGYHRKAILKVETHLVAEYTQRARAGAVMLLRAGFHYMAHQVEVLFHFVKLIELNG